MNEGLADVNRDGFWDHSVTAWTTGVAQAPALDSPGRVCYGNPGRPTSPGDGCNERQGRIYVYSGGDGALLHDRRSRAPGERALRPADRRAAAPGDVNGDGSADIYGHGFVQDTAQTPGPAEGCWTCWRRSRAWRRVACALSCTRRVAASTSRRRRIRAMAGSASESGFLRRRRSWGRRSGRSPTPATPDTRPQNARLRAASQQARLRLQRPTPRTGARASATITKRARRRAGQIEYVVVGKTTTAQFKVPIDDDGSWSLDQKRVAERAQRDRKAHGEVHSALIALLLPVAVVGGRRSDTRSAATTTSARPNDPPQAVQLLVDELAIGPGSSVLDLGAGTGRADAPAAGDGGGRRRRRAGAGDASRPPRCAA